MSGKRSKKRSPNSVKKGADTKILDFRDIRVAYALVIVVIILSLLLFKLLPFLIPQPDVQQIRDVEFSRAIASDQKFDVVLQEKPSSVLVSGKLVGGGAAKLYVIYEGKRYLVMDTDNLEQSKGLGGILGSAVTEVISNDDVLEVRAVCMDSCSIAPGSESKLTFEFEVDDGVFLVDSLVYTTERKPNNPPRWKGRTVFVIVSETSYELDLKAFYSDEDNQSLRFRVYSNPDGLNVEVKNGTLSYSPSENDRGTNALTVSATDGEVETLKDLTFFVYGDLPQEQRKAKSKIDSGVDDEIYRKAKAKVIVVLKDQASNVESKIPGKSKDEKEKDIERRKKDLKKIKDDVLQDITVSTKEISSVLTERSSLLSEGDTPSGIGAATLGGPHQVSSLIGSAIASAPTELTITHDYETLNVIAGEVTQEGLDKLEADDLVEAIFLDPLMKTNLDESVAQINAESIVADIITNNNTAQVQLTGQGQSVCVLDTGVDASHVALKDNVVAQQCFCSVSDLGAGGCCDNGEAHDVNALDDSITSHGTHVAGIISSDGDVRGVAPGSRIVAVKVCDFQGNCQGSDILAGIDYCNSNSPAYDISVISGSLSDNEEYDSNSCPSVFDYSFETARQLQITPVFASGNNFYDSGISYPACSPYTIAVGASEGINSIASFSNRGDLLDVLAPGVDITSTVRNNNYDVLSGTSQATPHVAAAVALIKQRNALMNISKNNAEVREALKQSGTIVSGYSFIDVRSAIDLIDSINIEETSYLTTGIDETGNFTSAGAPDAPTLNAPADASASLDLFRFLNLSVSDPDTNAMNVSIYADNGTTPTELIYFAQDVADGSEVTYNMTSRTVGDIYATDPDLVGYWKLDKNATDFSPSGANSGTFAGNAVINASGGHFGGSVKLDGAGDNVNVGTDSSLNIIGNVTLTAWIKPTSVSGFHRIFCYGGSSPNNNRYCMLLNDDKLGYQINNAGHTNTHSTAIAADVYTHVAMVYNDTTNSVELYVNGALEKKAETGNLASNSQTGYIGSSSAASQYFAGDIDDVALFNRSLTSTEIANIYQIQNDTYYWKATATDAAGSTGTSSTNSFIVGAAPDTTAPGINFTNPTPGDQVQMPSLSATVNTSIVESQLNEVVFNWDGTNYTLFNDSVIFKLSLDNLASLGESSSKVVDSSKYGNNGTVNGAKVNTTDCVYGGCYTFDADDYITVADDGDLEPTLPFTVGLWVKTSGTGNKVIIEKESDNDGWTLQRATAGNYQMAVGGSGNKIEGSDTTYSDGKWHYVVFVVRGVNDGDLYVDGNIDTNTGALDPTNPSYGSGALTLGSRSGSFGFVGNLDEVVIYNRTLSSAEINQSYMSYLQKFNQTQWYLYVNQTSKLNGTGLDSTKRYTFQTFASDDSGNWNSTEQRTTGDFTSPKINFTNPTPDNATTLTVATNVVINVSIEESYPGDIIFNWNGTNHSLYENLVLMYNFDNLSALGENSTFVVDATGINNGTFTGEGDEVSKTAAKYGNSGLDLDGSDQVDAGSLPGVTAGENVSISVWVYNENTAENKGIVARWESNKGFVLFQNDLSGSAKTKVSWQIDNYGSGDRAETPAGALPLNAWTHIVAVFDSADTSEELKIYINGELSATDNIVGTHLVPGGKNLDIGAYSTTTRFVGDIDEVMIWDKVITAKEARELYMMNLHKFNMTHYYLKVNQTLNSTTSLPDATYTYQTFVSDTAGTRNQTDLRTVIINTAGTAPDAAILNAPANQTNTTFTYQLLNATASDDDGDALNISIYGDNSTFPSELIGFFSAVPNGTQNTFNYSAPTAGRQFQDDANLTSYYRFDKNATDMSGYANDGTVTGAVLNATGGRFGGAYTYDGTNDDYVNPGSARLWDSSAPASVSFWTKLNGYNAGSYQYPMVAQLQTDQATGFEIFYSTTANYDGINFGSSDNFVRLKTETDVSNDLVGAWKHVVLVYDGVDRTADSSYTLYLDGVSQTLDASGSFAAVSNQNRIGFQTGSSTHFFGHIDEFATFNRTLSAAEVLNLYRLKDDTYRWKVDSTDSTGTTSSAVREFTVDTTTPLMVLTGPAAGATHTVNTIDLNATINDTNIKNVTLLINGTFNRSNTTGLNDEYNFTLNFVDGHHNWTLRAYDFAGNLNESSRVLIVSTVAADTIPPNVTITVPASNSFQNSNFTINATVVDGATVSSVKFRYENNTNNGSWYSMSNHAGNKWNGTFNISDVTDGNYHFRVNATDNSNNNNDTERILNVGIDTTLPTSLSYVSPTSADSTNTTTTSFTVNLTFTETSAEGCLLEVNDGSTGTNYTMTYNFGDVTYCNDTLTGQSDATYTYKVWVNDTANNLVGSSSRTLTIDTKTPNMTLTGLVDVANRSSLTIVLNATINDTNLKNVTLLINGTVNRTNSSRINDEYNFTLDFVEGHHNWTFRAYDFAGNVNDSSRIFIVDTTTPLMVLTGPADLASYTVNTIDLNATINDTNLKNVTLLINGTVNKTNSTRLNDEYNFTLDFAVGHHNWTFRAYDFAGNLNESSRVLIITAADTIPPNVTITVPASNSFQKSNFTINATVVDGATVSSVKFRYENNTNNGSWYSMSNHAGNKWNGTFNISDVTDGNYHFRVNATDNSNNNNDTERITNVGIDTTLPASLSYVSPTSADGLNTTTTSYTVNLTFTETSADSCLLDVGGTNYTMSLTVGGETYCNTTLTSQIDGVHTYKVWVNDTANNLVGSSSRTLTIDTKTPNMTLTGPVDGATHTVNTVDLNATINDTNLKNVTLLINSTVNKTNSSRLNDEYNFTLNFADGHYNWTFRAYDYTGNLNESSRVLIINTNIAPDVPTLNSPNNLTNTTNRFQELNFSVTDPNGDLMNVSVYGSNLSSDLDLIGYFESLANGTSQTYNWTSPTVSILFPSKDSIVGYWKLDQNATDFSASGNNDGTVNGATLNRSGGKLGGSYIFDGTNDDISITDSNNFNTGTTFTVSSWIYPTAWPVTGDAWIHNIFCDEGSGGTTICFRIGSQGLENLKQRLAINIDDGSSNDFESTSDLGLNFWQHVTVTYDGSNVKFYIDGVLDRTQAFTNSPTQGSGNWHIGSSPDANRLFSGYIDEVVFFNKTLSASEINNMYSLESETYYWQVVSSDGKSSSKSSINEFDSDSDTPLLVLTSPLNAATVTTNNATLRATINDTNLKNVTLLINGTFNRSNTTGLNDEYNFTLDFVEGHHNWTLRAYDFAGNVNDSSRLLIVATDTTAPSSLTYVSPTSDAGTNTTSTSYTVNLTFTETNPGTCLLDVGGTNYTMSVTDGDTDYCNTTLTSQSDGVHTYKVWVNDTNNNQAGSSSRTLTIDTKNPNMTLTGPADGLSYAVNTIDVNATINDTNLKNVTLLINGTFNRSNTTGLNDEYNFTLDFVNGHHNWTLRAYDFAGNLNESSRLLIVDTVYPNSPTLNSPSNNTNITVRYQLLNATATSLDENPLNVSIYADNSTNTDKLIAYFESQSNGSEITYNWTSPTADMLFTGDPYLSGYWKLDINATDLSPNKHLSSVINAKLNRTGGYLGGAYTFDGSGDYITIEHSKPLNPGGQNITVSLWARGGSQGTFKYLLSKSHSTGVNGYALYTANTGTISFLAGTGSLTRSTANNFSWDNNWHHFVGTFNGSDIDIYVDGRYMNTTVAVGNLDNSNTFNLTLGQFQGGGAAFKGEIDEVMVLNQTLSASEISDLYRLQDATYSWKVKSDDGRLTNTSTTRQFTVDLTVPLLVLTAPADGLESFASTVDLTATINDTNLRNVTLLINGTVNRTNLSGTNVPYNFTLDFANGHHNWTIRAQDYTGNLNESSRLLIVSADITVPTMSYVSPTRDNDSNTSFPYVIINTSIVEPNLEKVVFDWNGTNYTISNNSLVALWTFDNRSSLNNNASHTSEDFRWKYNATFNGSSSFINLSGGKYGGGLQLEGSADHASVIDSTGLDGGKELTVMLWAKTSDNDAGYMDIISKFGSAGADRSWQIRHRNTSGAGERFNVIIYSADGKEDANLEPIYDRSSLLDGEWHHVAFTLSFNNGSVITYYDGEPIGNSNVLNTSSTLRTVSYPVTIGGVSATASFNGTLDQVKIFNTSLSAAEIKQHYHTNLYRFNVTQWYLYVNQSVNSTHSLVDGTYTYDTFSGDFSGNQNALSRRTITTETVAPTSLTYVSPTSADGLNTTTTSYTVNLTFTEANPRNCILDVTTLGVGTNYTMSLTNGGATYCNDTLSSQNDGVHTYKVWLNDTAGAVVGSSSRSLTIDTKTPNMTLTGPADGATHTVATVDLNATINDTNLKNVTLLINGTFNRSNTSRINDEYNFTLNFVNGHYNWTFRAYDFAGNLNESSRLLIVATDTTAPSGLTFASPTSDAGTNTTSTSYTVNLTFTETNPGTCLLDVGGTNYSMSVTDGDVDYCNTTLTSQSDGIHTYKVWVNDTNNNLAGSASRTLTIDTLNPNLTLTSPADGFVSSASTVDLTATINDTNLRNVTLLINGTVNRTNLSGTNVPYNFTLDFANGHHNWTIRAQDYTGNLNESSRLLIVSADITVPAMSYFSPTRDNDSNMSFPYVVINTSIVEPNLEKVVFDWNGTNYTISNSSLVALLTFDNRSSLNNNASHTSEDFRWKYNATFNGSSSFINLTGGKYGGGLQLDGSGDYASVIDSTGLDGGKELTVMLWAKTSDNDAGYMDVISKFGSAAADRSWLIRHRNTSGAGERFNIITYSADGKEDTNIEPIYDRSSLLDGKWHHIAFTLSFNNGSVITYYDGEQIGNSNVLNTSSTLRTVSYPVVIGGVSATASFNGTLDQVKIFNTSLSAAEIKQHYHTNLYRFNVTQWYLYVNQSVNSTHSLVDGTYTYDTFSGDFSGNQNTLSRRTITTETVAPTSLTYVSPTSADGLNTTITSYTVNLTFTEANPRNCILDVTTLGVGTNYSMSLTNGGATYCNDTLSSQNDGVHTYKVWVNDTAGAVVGSSSRSLTIDTKTPNMTLTGPADGATHTVATVDLNATINDTNLKNVTLLINGTVNRTNSSRLNDEYNFTLDFVNGHYNWTFRAYDFAGNLNESSRLLIVATDITAPSITVDSPGSSINYNFTSIDLNVSADETVSVWWYTLDSGATNTTFTPNTTVTGSEGSNTITIYANDSSDNEGSSSVTFTVDTINPNVSFVSPTPSEGNNQTSTSIYVNLSTSDSGEHYSFVDFDNDVVLWHTFEGVNSTGGAVDESSYTNNGQLFGNALINRSGKYGSAFYGDGTGDYIGGSDLLIPENSTEFAVSLWTKIRAGGSVESGLFEQRRQSNGYSFFLYSSAARWVNFGFADIAGGFPSINSAGAISADEWHHIVGMYNGTNLSLYIDGTLRNIDPETDGLKTTGSPLLNDWLIGDTNAGARAELDGSIDEVIVFNRSLSLAEIAALYNSSVNKFSRNFTSLADAVHTFKGHAIDLAGNSNSTSTRSVTIDTILPLLVQTSPADAATVTTNNATLRATINDTNLRNVTLLINSTVNKTNISGFNSAYNFTLDFVNGHYNWTVRAQDYTGNLNESSRTLIISTSAPTVAYVTPTPATGSGQTSTSVTVNVTAVTGGLNVDVCMLEWNGVNETMTEVGAGTSISCNVAKTGLADSTYSFKVHVNDTNNRMTRTEIRSVTVDTSFPNISYVSPTVVNGTPENFVIINASITDPNVDTVIFNWNGTNTTVLNKSLILMYNFDNVSALGATSTKIVDVIGGVNGTLKGTAIINLTGGKYGGALQLPGGTGDTNYVYSTDTTRLDGMKQLSYAFWLKPSEAELNDASYRMLLGKYGGDLDTDRSWNIQHRDASGVGNDRFALAVVSDNGKFVGDDIIYKGASLYDGNWHHVAVTINFLAGNMSLYYDGLYQGEFAINTSSSIQDGGTLRPLTVGCLEVSSICFNGSIDNVMIWNRSLTFGEVEQLYFMNLHKTDVNQWYLYVNRSLNVSNGLAEGTYTHQTYVQDIAGSQNTTGQRSAIIDATLPNLTITFPTDGATVTTFNATLRATINDTNLANVTLLINSTVNRTNTSGFNSAYNFTLDFVNGHYNWTFRARDIAGNVNESSRLLIVNKDLVAPATLTYVNPTSGGGANISSTSYTVNLTFVDDNPGSCLLDVGGTNYTMSVTDGDVDYCNTTLTSQSDGIHIYKVWVNDTNNNLAGSASRTLTIDTVLPNLTLTFPADAATVTTNNATLRATINDTNLRNVTLLINSTVNRTNTSGFNSAYNFTLDFVNGHYNWTFRARDIAGNVNESSRLLIVDVDTTAPSVTINTPTSGWYNASFIVNATLRDSNTISSAQYRYENSTTNGSWVNLTNTSGYWNDTLVITSIFDGNYTIRINVSDSGGYENATETVILVGIDDTIPVLNLTNTSPRFGAPGTIFNVSVNVTENNVDTVTATLFHPDNESKNVLTLTGSGEIYSATWNSTGNVTGPYIINVTINDSAGNRIFKPFETALGLASNAKQTLSTMKPFTSGEVRRFNFTNSTSVLLDINAAVTATETVSVSEYTQNIKSRGVTGRSGLGKFVDIELSHNLNGNLNNATFKIYYNATDISTNNLNESTLKMYKWNTSNSSWFALNSTLDTDDKVVAVTLNRFSSFGVFGEEIAAATPATPAASSGGSSGGGGGGSSGTSSKPSVDISLDKSIIKTEVKQEVLVEEIVTISNTGKDDAELTAEIEGFDSYVLIQDLPLNLKAGESKAVKIQIFPSAQVTPGTKIGKIKFKLGGVVSILDLVVDIKELKALFDITAVVAQKYQQLQPGDEAEAEFVIYNLGDPVKVDVLLYYSIRDLEGNDVVYQEDTFAVTEQKRVTRKLKVPEDVTPGHYLFYGRTIYQGQVASSSALLQIPDLTVVDKLTRVTELQEKKSYVHIIGILLMLLLVIILSGLIFSYRSGLVGSRRSLDSVSAYLASAEKSLRNKEMKNASLYYRRARKALLSSSQGSVIANPKVVKRVLEFDTSRLDATGKKSKIKSKSSILAQQLRKWKSLGYDTSVVEESLREGGRSVTKLSKSQLASEKKKLVSRINVWKKKGYNIDALRKRLADVDVSSKNGAESEEGVKKQVDKLERDIRMWKRKGYNTQLLEKKLKSLRTKEKGLKRKKR